MQSNYLKIKSISINYLKKLIKNSKCNSDVLRQLNIHPKDFRCRTCLKELINTNNIDISHFKLYNNIENFYTKEQIEKIVTCSKNLSEVIYFCKKNPSSSTYKAINKLIKFYNIDISHFKLYNNINVVRYNNFEMFREHSKISRTNIKNRIIRDKLISYECLFCKNNGIWKEQKLSLQLEHKNGINDDHRLDNLCFLCPNCHSQTQSYCRRKYNN